MTMMTRRNRMMAAVALLVVVLCALWSDSGVDAKQNLKKTTCPLCDMDVRPEISAPIFGNQAIYACEMAGHIDQLRDEPKNNLGSPVQVNIKTDKVYKDATEMECPVCGKGFDELKYAVPWIELGDQKIFTCSEEHAMEVFNNPTQFIAASQSTGGFCNKGSALEPRGSVMFNGFQLAIGENETCALLLFQPWVISSAVKYAFAFLGIVCLGMSMEGLGVLREYVEKRLYRDHGIVFSAADYVQLSSPSSMIKAATEQTGLNPTRLTMIRRIPFWCKLVLGAFYMLQLTIAYWLMLIIMMYETLFFFAVILGLGLGFLFFKDTEADKMSGNVDPCCST